MSHSVRVGISGWTYPPWRKTFYPPNLPQRRELEFASRQVTSIEINGSFYALQRPTSFLKWHDSVPDDFIFSIKAHRYITHIKKLNEVEEPLANFFASGILFLGKKLGPILWQFPPSMKFNVERFENFLKLLPHDFSSAVRLSKKHGDRIKDSDLISKIKKSENWRIRHAVEVRHDSFQQPEFIQLLKKYKVAIVIADSAGKWPYFEDVTTDFAYVRLHGSIDLYPTGYTESALNIWASKIKKWLKSRDAYLYFDNDVKVQAPYNAVGLLERLIKNYKPFSEMDKTKVKGLSIPGPRLAKDKKPRLK